MASGALMTNLPCEGSLEDGMSKRMLCLTHGPTDANENGSCKACEAEDAKRKDGMQRYLTEKAKRESIGDGMWVGVPLVGSEVKFLWKEKTKEGESVTLGVRYKVLGYVESMPGSIVLELIPGITEMQETEGMLT